MKLTAAKVTTDVARANRKWLEREIARDLRGKERKKLRELRAGVRGVKKRRALWRKAASNRYKKIRAAARAQHAELRRRVRERVNQKIARERLAVREAHVQRRARIAAEFSDLEQRAQKMLEAERDYQRELRSGERKAKKALAPRRTAAEARAESDDLVRNNLTPDELVVFEKVKGQIKAGPRRSRTEAFAEWLQENEEEANIIRYGAAEWSPGELEQSEAAYFAELEEQRAGERLRKATGKHAAAYLGNGNEPQTVKEYLADVPF
ncbi:MAG: hypothetical protein ACYTAF_07700 [Planctomycetota bacterium]